jgi:signal transduction histidine kinase
VFQNLLQNSIQHTPAGGVVKVRSEPPDRDEKGRAWLTLVVEDSGPGITPELIQRVFEPFFSQRRGGTGLGLAIVRRIVEDHGGTVLAGNRPGGGAAMSIRLPA